MTCSKYISSHAPYQCCKAVHVRYAGDSISTARHNFYQSTNKFLPDPNSPERNPPTRICSLEPQAFSSPSIAVAACSAVVVPNPEDSTEYSQQFISPTTNRNCSWRERKTLRLGSENPRRIRSQLGRSQVGSSLARVDQASRLFVIGEACLRLELG